MTVVPFEVLPLIVGKYISIGWHVHHGDIFTAFLIGDVDGELYIRVRNSCYTLQKSLYDLKQSPHLWHKKLENSLQKN